MKNRAFNWNAVADFPVEALRGCGSDDGTFAISHERFPLIVRNDEFREDLALVFNIDGELRKEVSFILIDAAEPIVMSDGFHGRDSKDLIAIGHGKRLDNGDFVEDVYKRQGLF